MVHIIIGQWVIIDLQFMKNENKTTSDHHIQPFPREY